jgi:hypothetical protein
MKKANITFMILLLLAFSIRLAWFYMTDNTGCGDAAARLNITQIWLYSHWYVPRIDYLEILNPSLDWLPLHFYLIGALCYIFHDLIYAPRLFTLFISVISLIPLYRICLIRYGQTAAYIGAAILACYGMHIFLSSLILSESFYIYFLLWSYYFIERYKINQDDRKNILLLAASLFCCCLLRYEAWFFAPLVILTIPFIKKIRLKNFLILLLLPAIAVCFVMTCEYLQGQHPLRGILYSDFEVRQTSLYTGGFDYATLLQSYLPCYILASIFFLIRYIRYGDKSNGLILALYLLPVSPFIYKLLNGTLTPQARYLVIYMAPGIVLIAGFIYQVSVKFKVRTVSLILFITAYIIVANVSFARQIDQHRDKLKYLPGFEKSAYYFRDSITLSKAYVDYGQDLSGSNWMVYANQYDAIHSASFIDSAARVMHVNPQIFIQRTYKGVRYRISGHEAEWHTWKKSSFDDLLLDNGISHIVLFPDGPLSRMLHFSKEQEAYQHKHFKRLFSQDGYMIYQIE